MTDERGQEFCSAENCENELEPRWVLCDDCGEAFCLDCVQEKTCAGCRDAKTGRYLLTTVLDFTGRVEGQILMRSSDREKIESEMETTEGIATGGPLPRGATLQVIDTDSPQGKSYAHMKAGSRWRVQKRTTPILSLIHI